ncbi:hypothetical protein MNEG_7610, partial [Monoraphidium neglectum]
AEEPLVRGLVRARGPRRPGRAARAAEGGRGGRRRPGGGAGRRAAAGAPVGRHGPDARGAGLLARDGGSQETRV